MDKLKLNGLNCLKIVEHDQKTIVFNFNMCENNRKMLTFFIISKERSENTQRFSQMNITSNQERQQTDIKRRAFQIRLFSWQNLFCFEIFKKKTRKNQQNETLDNQKKKPFRKSNVETRYWHYFFLFWKIGFRQSDDLTEPECSEDKYWNEFIEILHKINTTSPAMFFLSFKQSKTPARKVKIKLSGWNSLKMA